MKSTERDFHLILTTKELYAYPVISLTVNFCVLLHFIIPVLCKVLTRCLGSNRGESFVKFGLKKPGFFSQICTGLIFYTALPVCAVIFLCKTSVLQNPFFHFDQVLVILFAINAGFYVFRIAQITYYHAKIPHYQALLIHHTVAITTYLVIIHFEQNAISGLIGLLMEGNLVFTELERLLRILKVEKFSRIWKINLVSQAVTAVLWKAVIPVGLLTYVFMNSSEDLFRMNYSALAFCFLSLVFFSCVNFWFIKDVLYKCWCYFRRTNTSPPVKVYSLSEKGLVSTIINHDGLLKLSNQQYHGAEVNITCNVLWESEEKLYDEKSNEEKTLI